MGWFKRQWGRFRHVIHIGAYKYMIRYRLLGTPWFSIYLHHILQSDADRELHDHPWNFWSFILWGGYWEITPEEKEKLRRIFSFGAKKARDLHRVVLREKSHTIRYSEKPPSCRDARWGSHFSEEVYKTIRCWSLVVVGKKTREWGFQTDSGWMDWKEFHRMKGYNLDGSTKN